MKGTPLSNPKPNQRVILWDIDGTLVSSRASRADKHVTAVEVFLGCDLPTQEHNAGKTDRQILSELLKVQGTKSSPAALSKVLGILDALSVKEMNQYPVLCNPGVTNALKMASSAGWINGLLTGNTPVRARTKLKSASIWCHFNPNFAYFGDVASSRYDLVGQVVSALSSDDHFEVVIVGDTPLDVRSAQEHKLQVVAIATGLYSAEELRELDPNLVLNDWQTGSTSFMNYLNSLHA
jgi:phosphoglycolate phosphatase-like HAD superfamily hydrolase